MGLANIVTAGGIFSLMLGAALQERRGSILGGIVLALSAGLTWKSARALDAKPAPLVLALVGMMVVVTVVGLASAVPAMRDFTASVGISVSAAYFFAAAATLWFGRADGLVARWPIIVFVAAHATVLSIGAYGSLTGSVSPDLAPSLMSLFGMIYFEGIIFTLGTAVFFLALVKERSEAASTMAAHIDPLTGILNRGAFMESARRIVERCRRDGAPVSVMMFDLDLFKDVNDRYGHAAGDAVIQRFCQVTAFALRPNDIFGRIGGEEFAVALPALGIEAAYARADEIRVAFARNCRFIGDVEVDTTVSGGVSTSVDGKQTLSALLEYSDAALYRAKAGGRNRVRRADQPNPQG